MEQTKGKTAILRRNKMWARFEKNPGHGNRCGALKGTYYIMYGSELVKVITDDFIKVFDCFRTDYDNLRKRFGEAA